MNSLHVAGPTPYTAPETEEEQEEEPEEQEEEEEKGRGVCTQTQSIAGLASLLDRAGRRPRIQGRLRTGWTGD